MPEISTKPLEKKFATVNGKQMAYAELGGDQAGTPIWFQHGNPTSSYLWRNIMPYAADLGRCIAPDLIGMGDSDKLDQSGPDRYTYVEQREYLYGLIDQLIPHGPVHLVLHDWGSALGFNWAMDNPDRVASITYMEAIVAPVPSWEDFPAAVREVFQGFRSPAGEQMVLEHNVFVEMVLPDAILRDMTDVEMAVYRAPFVNPGEDRRPTLTWPRQIPLVGEPADVVEIVSRYGAFMAETEIPKLFVNAEPGALIQGPVRDLCRSWKNQTEITVRGSHFIQEDSPHQIGAALREFLTSL